MIDCSKTLDYFKEQNRMCSQFAECSDDCPMAKYALHDPIVCSSFQHAHTEKAVAIVQKWSDEHPQTR